MIINPYSFTVATPPVVYGFDNTSSINWNISTTDTARDTMSVIGGLTGSAFDFQKTDLTFEHDETAEFELTWTSGDNDAIGNMWMYIGIIRTSNVPPGDLLLTDTSWVYQNNPFFSLAQSDGSGPVLQATTLFPLTDMVWKGTYTTDKTIGIKSILGAVEIRDVGGTTAVPPANYNNLSTGTYTFCVGLRRIVDSTASTYKITKLTKG
jgi:hypothetical protein